MKNFKLCGQTGIISSVNTEGISSYNLKYILTAAPKSWYDMCGARRGKQMTSVNPSHVLSLKAHGSLWKKG